MVTLLASCRRTRSVGVISSLSTQHKVVPETCQDEAENSEMGDMSRDFPDFLQESSPNSHSPGQWICWVTDYANLSQIGSVNGSIAF